MGRIIVLVIKTILLKPTDNLIVINWIRHLADTLGTAIFLNIICFIAVDSFSQTRFIQRRLSITSSHQQIVATRV